MTIHITWHGVWTVGKYVLTFGGGFVAGVFYILGAFSRGMGRAFGWR